MGAIDEALMPAASGIRGGGEPAIGITRRGPPDRGNGSHEVRNWVAAHAAAGSTGSNSSNTSPYGSLRRFAWAAGARRLGRAPLRLRTQSNRTVDAERRMPATAEQPGTLFCTLVDRRSSVRFGRARHVRDRRGIVQVDVDSKGEFRADFPQGVFDLVISARGELSLTLRGIGVLAGQHSASCAPSSG